MVAVAGTLGRSAAGFVLLQQDRADDDEDLVREHVRPRPPYEQGPVARSAGATAMIDLSDGLVRDAGRVAAASGVRLELSTELLRADLDRLTGVLDDDAALGCVLTGGEEHSLLACFPPEVALPDGWRRIGQVGAGEGVTVDGRPRSGGGWDHFHP